MVIDKTFSFAHRALWNMDNAAEYEQFYNQLQFETADIKEISKKLGEIQLEMVANFTTLSTDELANKLSTKRVIRRINLLLSQRSRRRPVRRV